MRSYRHKKTGVIAQASHELPPDLWEPTSEGLYACPVCSGTVTRFGQTCDLCKEFIEREDDRLERESGR